MIKVEKRRPFGFKGEWGVLYKLYTFDDVENNIIQYQNHNYLKIPTKLQLKAPANGSKMSSIEQQVGNLENLSTKIILITTDAFFDVSKGSYKCVVDGGDIILFRGEWWQVDKVDVEIKYTPARQETYTCYLTKIDEEVLVW